LSFLISFSGATPAFRPPPPKQKAFYKLSSNKILGATPPTHPPARTACIIITNLNKMYYLSPGCALTLGVFIQLLNLLQE
jgi:hypothetical protein